MKRFTQRVALAAILSALIFSARATSVIGSVTAGAADQSVVIKIIDSTDGTPETGVVFNTAGIDLEYWRYGANSVTDITEATQTVNGAHADGGFVHLGNGYYRLDLPDAAVASGAPAVEVMGTVTGMIVIGGALQISPPANAVAWAGVATATDDIALLAQLAKTTHITGFNDITSASVWAVDATGQQTQGTFGQAIGDPAADTDSIWALVNTNLDTNVGSRMATFTLPTNFSSMDINATGGVGLDWGNVQNATTTVGLTNTTVDLVSGAVDDAALNSDAELQAAAAAALNAEDGGNFTQVALSPAGNNAIRLDLGVPAPTTIATLASQTSFTLTAGSADDNAYNGYGIMIRDASTAAQQALGCVRDYTGSTKTVTLLDDPGIFTMAVSDNVDLLPAYCDAQVQQDLLDTAILTCTVDTANFAGSSTTFSCDLTDSAGVAVTTNIATDELKGKPFTVLSGAQKYEERYIFDTTWDGTNNELQVTIAASYPFSATLADGVTIVLE